MSESRIRRAEIAREQAHVDQVYARLDELRTQAKNMLAKGYELGHGAQREAVFEQASMLFERDMMVHHANQTLQALDTEYEGLVFGRLDHAANGTAGEVVHVGRLGIRDAEFENLVTDWRAPAAEAFYQATAQEPMGIVRRRAIRCSGRQVLDVDDDVLIPGELPQDMAVVGEGALMAAIGRARSEHMRDIVATIQKEQDEVIRAPWQGVTEITGGPGTGKTAVALHRTAYLLYRHRRRLGGAGVLVVGPSPVFTDYISRVLPSMGETNVELRSLGTMLDGFAAEHTDPAPVAAVKGSLRMRKVLLRAMRATPPSAPTQLRITYGGDVLRLETAELDRVRRRVHARGGPPNRSRVHAAEALLEALADVAERNADTDGREFTPAARHALVMDLGERIDFHRFLVEWWPELRPAEILDWLGDAARLRKAAGSTLTPDEVKLLSASFADRSAGYSGAHGLGAAGGKYPGAHGLGAVGGKYSVADIALIDELRVLVGKPKRRRSEPRPEPESAHQHRRPAHYDEYSHVVVDEAQDLSPMQWRMVGRRGRYASWTVVGDPVQSSWPDPADAAAAADVAFGANVTRRRFALRTNYRNSAEIFALAARAVGDQATPDQLPVAVRNTGVEPELRTVPDLAEQTRRAASELLDSVEGTVGVISAMDRVADVDKWLSTLADQRLRVVGSLDAKGLEYDAVVLVEPQELIDESVTGRRVLYVALTRATQQLIVLSTDATWLPAAR